MRSRQPTSAMVGRRNGREDGQEGRAQLSAPEGLNEGLFLLTDV